MNLAAYLRDRVYVFALHVMCMVAAGVVMGMSGNTLDAIALWIGIWFLIALGYFTVNFLLARRECNRLLRLAEGLEPKYLLAEVIGKPYRNEYRPYYKLLKMASKSMLEQITSVKNESKEYREYIEQWVHEIKTPIAAMKLIAENNRNAAMEKMLAELAKTENFVEQALFYARSENVEQDFIVRETELAGCISGVLAANKQMFIQNNVRIETEGLNVTVYSDAKWLEFIIKQLLVNAVQYRAERDALILIYAEKGERQTALHVQDNGIGILESEIGRVFEKGFTGSNGRRQNKSTGLGLYLCKKLCARLGVTLGINSKSGEYTDVILRFVR